ncbi:carboxypeptidase-like regulatory domain-containing protein [Archangium lansingense]|uniref:Carboxypeptidase-like regulatory domain-containing protein n=1 Tax=Archangium lansingense TaxID=2995310 RepID=A0ABT3ZX31_9BACT|nr:carboxypeptidase-like regulatory domain-containing protein [Archangium lansinium]MCY1073671.1 carboxypeptidase-like regulatory domain-containing protein [Archangium lansinium]
MKKHWAVVLPLLVVGCTPPEDKDGDGIVDGVRDPDSVSVVVPANPKGTVSGQVLNTRMVPIQDAAVKLTIGSATAEKPFEAKTDASGNFLITSVPAGAEVLVTISKEGHATLRASALVPSHAGNIPINNGNANIGAIALAETQGSVSFTLLTPSGNPARGAKAYLEATPAGTIAYNGGTASAVSSVVVAADANNLGVVTFSNVPAPAELARIGGVGDAAGGYRLWVDPVDTNGDGIIDAAGYAKKIDASTLMVSGGSQLLRLPAPRNDAGDGSQVSGFQLIATNVPSLNYVKLADVDPAKAQMELQKKPMRNLIKPGEPIYLGFSQPVARESLLAIVTDEHGRDKYDVGVTSSAAGDVYSLQPPFSIREGQEYNIILRATSAYDGTVHTWKGFFISGDPNTPRPLGIASAVFKDGVTGTVGTLDPGECIIFSFTQNVTSMPAAQLDVLVSTGEASPPSFKAIAAAPPNSNACFGETSTRFPIDTVNFNDATTRFYFSYSGPAINLAATPVKVKADFTKFQSTDLSQYFETAWGGPVSSTTIIESTLTKQP